MRLSKRLDALSPFSYCGTDYAIRLDANESCVPLLPHITEHILHAIKSIDVSKYPDNSTTALRNAYAKAFCLDAECVVAGNGSDELINMLIGRVIPDDAIVVGVEYDFGSYWSNCAIYGKKSVKIKRNDEMGFSADDLIAAAQKNRADLVIFSNPNNPSGSILTRDEVIKIVEALDCLVVADEAYMDFADESVLDLAGSYPNLIVLRTLSKAMGVAGARLGFAISTPELSLAMRKVRDAYNVSAIDQAVGITLLAHPEQGELTLKETARIMKILQDRLQDISIRATTKMKVYPSHANFVLMRIENANALMQYLHDRDISLRAVGNDMVRISAADGKILNVVLNELDAFMTGGN